MHKASTCQGEDHRFDESKENTRFKDESPSKKSKTMKLAKALADTIKEEMNDSSNSDTDSKDNYLELQVHQARWKYPQEYMWIIAQLVMPYGSLMVILAVYALYLIYERGGEMGTSLWRVTSIAGNIIANYLLSISIIFLVQIFYPELLSRDSTNVDDRAYVPKSKRWTKVQSVITWLSCGLGVQDRIFERGI